MSRKPLQDLVECPAVVVTRTLDAAFKVHRYFGPGLLESVYEQALQAELLAQGLTVSRQVAVPVYYEAKRLGPGFRADLLVNDSLLIEIKAVETLNSVHLAQVITYLKLLGYKRGLLINFNAKVLENGVRRVAI